MSSPTRSSAVAPADKGVMLLGVLLLILFCLFDAVTDAFVYHDGTFFEALLLPPSHQCLDRLMAVALTSCFFWYAIRVNKGRNALQLALQDALAKAEHERAKLFAIVEAMGDAVSIQDHELIVQYQNRAHQQRMGNHVGEKCHLAYRDEPEPCAGCHLLQAFEDGDVHRLEVNRASEEGMRCLEIIGSAVRDEAGRVKAGIELVRDITDRKLVEQMARKQAELLQHLIDTLPNPIYYEDASGRFIWCNPAFADWLAKPREELIAKRMAEVAPLELCRALQEREPVPGEGRGEERSLLRGDGEPRDVIFYRSRFSDSPGEADGVVGVIIDITERKQAEEEIRSLNVALTKQAVELQQANRELEAFSHAISHDLRTPLTRIYSYAQLLQSYGALEGDDLFYIRSVNEGCLQLESILNALMELCRVTEVELTMSRVDLSGIAMEKTEQLRLAEPERLVDFRIAPELFATGDQRLLNLALENLLGNAWKYTSRSSEAVIELGSFQGADGQTVFFVRDNGAGFDSSRSDDLFKPFRRLHSSSDFPGTGLGLATVRRIIQRHNGRVWGESQPGAGATFYFTVNG